MLNTELEEEHNVCFSMTDEKAVIKSIRFEIAEIGTTIDQMLEAFEQFALAIGYQPESIKNAILDRADEIEATTERVKSL